MSKEWLEEIDNIVEDLISSRSELTTFVNDYYLQAERVEELERKYKVLSNFHNIVFEKLIENEKQSIHYREFFDEIKELELYINYTEEELYTEVLRIVNDFSLDGDL